MNTLENIEMLNDEELKTIAGGDGIAPGPTTYIQDVPVNDGWKGPY